MLEESQPWSTSDFGLSGQVLQEVGRVPGSL